MSEPNSPSTQADVKILGSKSPPKPLLSCKILHIPNILKSQVQPTHELRAVYTMLGKQEWASVSILKGRPQSHRRQISGPNKILNTNQACSKHLLFLFLFSAKAVITLPHSVSCHPLILWRVCVHVCACAFHPPCFLRLGLSLAWDSQSRWGWLPCQQAPGPICTRGYKNAPPHLAFLHGSWVSNWGSNTLPNKLPPHPSMVCFYLNTQQDHKLVSSHPAQHGALGGVVLLKEVCFWGWTIPNSFLSLSAFCLYIGCTPSATAPVPDLPACSQAPFHDGHRFTLWNCKHL